MSRGLLSLKQRHDQDAWNDYNSAARRTENNAAYLYGRGIAALRLGRTSEGQADIAAATARDANIASLYQGYGVTPKSARL